MADVAGNTPAMLLSKFGSKLDGMAGSQWVEWTAGANWLEEPSTHLDWHLAQGQSAIVPSQQRAKEWPIRVAKLLIGAGLQPDLPDTNGKLLQEIALEHGNLALAAFWRCYQGLQAGLVMMRALESQQEQCPLFSCTLELVHKVLRFAFPQDVAWQLLQQR